MDRVRRLKLILWSLTGVALAVGVVRFLTGLGATTNLSDGYPWGLWIGFDVMGGVALAGGGFVLTAIVYVFKREEFHPIVKPAVLTAFLGYVAVIIGLLFDLGLPWNIWHMMVYWNPHSPLFEVGWCVMLYTTVLLLEFSPVPLELFSAWAKIRAFLMKFRLVFVILGIGLSTLHQSSLGSLFLIMPYKVHALWYSPILPILFFLSAVMLGLYMVTWESLFTGRVYRREWEGKLIANLQVAVRWVALVYLAVRFGDLAIRGQLALLGEPGWHTSLFWVEISVMALVPIVLTFIPQVRNSLAGQWTIASMGVFGVVLNRVDVGGLAHMAQYGKAYIPSWTEFVISAGVVSMAGIVFLFFVEHFKVWEDRPSDPAADPEKLPEFEPVSDVSLGDPAHAGWVRNSLAFIFCFAFGLMLLPFNKVGSDGFANIPVVDARGGDTLFIDGNWDGYGVFFPHAFHEVKNGGEASCAKCHHMNLPGDRASRCGSCHSQMYQVVDAFQHDWHSSPDGANLSCAKCHDLDKPKSKESVLADMKECTGCHKPMIAEGSTIEVDTYQAVSYMDAMHTLCITCHKEVMDTTVSEMLVVDDVQEQPDGTVITEELVVLEEVHKDLTLCTNCHTGETLLKVKDGVKPAVGMAAMMKDAAGN